jgi:hypothetical protein
MEDANPLPYELSPSCYGISFLICLKQFYPYPMLLIKYSGSLLSQEVPPYSSDILALLASFGSSRVKKLQES